MSAPRPPADTTDEDHSAAAIATVIIVTFNNAEIIERCLTATELAVTRWPHELVVVDNGSCDDTVARVEAHGGIRCIATSVNAGFAIANNLAIEATSGRCLVLVNSDAFPDPGSIDELLDFLDTHPDAGIVGARLRNEAGVIEPSAGWFPSLFGNLWVACFLHRLPGLSRLGVGLNVNQSLYREARRVDWVTAAFCAARRELGPLPARGFMYGEDVEWAAKGRSLGYTTWLQPAATGVHLGNATVRQTQAPGFKQIRRLEFELRWFGDQGLRSLRAVRAVWALHAGVRLVLYALLLPIRPAAARRGITEFAGLLRHVLGAG